MTARPLIATLLSSVCLFVFLFFCSFCRLIATLTHTPQPYFTWLKGFWFSTLEKGEGVSWRQLSSVSVSKNCSDEAHYTAVETDGAACFAAHNVPVGPRARDIKLPGWIECYYATVLGPVTNMSYDRTGGWTAEKLGRVLDDSFVSCPNITA
jgi:hypothetical protein